MLLCQADIGSASFVTSESQSILVFTLSYRKSGLLFERDREYLVLGRYFFLRMNAKFRPMVTIPIGLIGFLLGFQNRNEESSFFSNDQGPINYSTNNPYGSCPWTLGHAGRSMPGLMEHLGGGAVAKLSINSGSALPQTNEVMPHSFTKSSPVISE
jgi:hypothetical protein